MIDVPDQQDPDHERNDQQNQIDGQRIAPEDLMRHGVETRLGEVEQTGEADDETVYLAEGLEAEYLGRVVGHGGVVQRPVEDEEDDIAVRGPQVRQHAQDADGRGDGDEEGEREGRARVVEHEADERDAQDAADR